MCWIDSEAVYRRSYFFDAGIHFTCRQCGQCCTGESGTIYVTPDEISAIAGFLGVPEARLIAHDLFSFKDSYSIRELADGRCSFYRDGCLIYAARPFQCRSFPFWFDNLRSVVRWREVARLCPGIGAGRRFDKEEILALAQATRHI